MNYQLLDLPPFDNRSILSSLKSVLFDKILLDTWSEINIASEYKLYAIVDGAMNEEVENYLEIYEPQYRTLYPENYSNAAGWAQPYLVDMKSSDEFAQWFLENGYGNSRGIFVFSLLEIDDLYENIKEYAIGHIEEGNKETFFRFYDPRIFPSFLQIIMSRHIEDIFSQHNIWLCENFLEAHKLDVYTYNNEKKLIEKNTYGLLLENTLKSKIDTVSHPRSKNDDKKFKEKGLLFSYDDIQLMTQYKELLFTKQVCLSLMLQVPKLQKVTHFQEISRSIYTIIHKGIEKFNLSDMQTNYLWVVAHTLHNDIDVLLEQDKTYKQIFDIQMQVSQTYKQIVLEEIIERLEEKIKDKEITNV